MRLSANMRNCRRVSVRVSFELPTKKPPNGLVCKTPSVCTIVACASVVRYVCGGGGTAETSSATETARQIYTRTAAAEAAADAVAAGKALFMCEHIET